MFKARIRNTDNIVEADDLKVIENVQGIDFVCVDKKCNIPVIPSSFKENNKKRPFFKKYKNQDHSNTCSYSSYLYFIEIGKTRRLTELEFEKLDYPSQLFISVPKSRESNTTTNDRLPEIESTSTRRLSSGEFTEVAHSNRKVTSISQIVDFYISCPYNRDVDLDLLGSKAAYKYQFRRIYGPNNDDYIDNKIFYGIIDLEGLDSVKYDGNTTIIKLHECEKWEKNTRSLMSKNKRVNPYLVRINNNEITSHKLSRILKERETVANQSKNDYFKKIKKEKVEAYIFFLGKKPSNKEPYTFEAINGFISFRYTAIKHPLKE